MCNYFFFLEKQSYSAETLIGSASQSYQYSCLPSVIFLSASEKQQQQNTHTVWTIFKTLQSSFHFNRLFVFSAVCNFRSLKYCKISRTISWNKGFYISLLLYSSWGNLKWCIKKAQGSLMQFDIAAYCQRVTKVECLTVLKKSFKIQFHPETMSSQQMSCLWWVAYKFNN